MDSTPATKGNRIKILTQHALLKNGLENLHHINSKECSLKFVKTGFTITCATSIQQQAAKKATKSTAPVRTSRTQAVLEFCSDKLYNYDYRLVTDKGEVVPSFECIAVTDEFMLRMKGLKAEDINMSLVFDKNNKLAKNRITFQIPGNPALTYLDVKMPERRIIYSDQLATWFGDKPPVFRPSCSVFQEMISRVKQNKASSVEFKLNKRTRNCTVCCYDSVGKLIFADPLVTGEMDDSYEEEEPGDTFIVKHISLQQNEWLNHFHKLCDGSTVFIHMKEDPKSPMVIVTCVGHHGKIIYSVPDSSI